MATTAKGNKFRTEFVLKGHRYVRYFDTKGSGESWEAYVRLQVSLGKPIEEDSPSSPHSLTWGHALKLAKEHWQGTKNERMAVANAMEVVDHFGPTQPMSKAKQAEVSAFVQSLRKREGQAKGKNLSSATINRKMAALSLLVRIAKEQGATGITISTVRLKEAEGRLRFLTREEEAEVINDMANNEGKAFADFVALALDTGGRLSELLQLRLKDVQINGDKAAIVFRGVTTKSGKSRAVPLTKRALAIMESHPEGWPKHWNQHTITHAWARMRERIGKSDDTEFVFHACRHTCATRLLEATGNLVVVRDWLGHSDIRVTTRYTKVVATSLAHAVSALEGVTPTPS